MMNKKPLSIYVHIPFCKQKCIYCDFLSFGGTVQAKQEQYVSALCKELALYKSIADRYQVKTIFFGGGTPSYIDAEFVWKILDTIRKIFWVTEDAEITLEGNPDSLSLEKLKVYRKAGINRLSIGLQSAKDDLLVRLGRVHNYQQFLNAYTNARQAGFRNINIDLMSGLPGETEASYLETLERITALQPEHISAYSLIVEEGTPLYENDNLLDLLPSEETDRKLYAKTKEMLLAKGYNRYEISNYAKEGFACWHNLVYWTGGEYLGVGLGASSYISVPSAQKKRVRFHGMENLEEYITFFNTYEKGNVCGSGMVEQLWQEGYQELQVQTKNEAIEEFMFLGLRLTKGISKEEFEKRFGVTIESIYMKMIEKYKREGLLVEDGGRIYLSDVGIDVSNMVMSECLLE